MKRLVFPAILILALPCRPVPAGPLAVSTRPVTETSPQPPQVGLAEGTALVRLVRSAMREYLQRRTPADEQAIPVELKGLTNRGYTVAVTLRDLGKVVARTIRSGAPVARNVIAAALEAMRSPLLPDRVTQDVLDRLTVEVEILGEPREVRAADIRRFVQPGLTGLMMIRGTEKSYSLPSAAYGSGLDADQMRRDCLLQAALTADSASVQPAWAVFAAKHYVGYPDGRTVWLYRGKVLEPPESIDERALAAAAERIGEFLVRRQDPSGFYKCGEGETAPVEHLYATWAMSRLARDAARPELSSSVLAGLRYAARAIKQEGPIARVATGRPEEDLAATAMLVLATSSLRTEDQPESLRAQLVAYLKDELGDVKRLELRMAASRPSGRYLRGAYLACLALETALPGDSPDKAAQADLKRSLGRAVPPDAESDLWRMRAGVPDLYSRGATLPARDLLLLPVEEAGAADEIGGFAVIGQGPTTVLTSLVAVNLVGQLGQGPSKAAQEAARDLAGARRFCYRMTFRPLEAFFADAPAEWVGAVRASPESARVTVEACAAAIEALLARPPAIPSAPTAPASGRAPRA